MKKISLKDIASLAGVSPSTVSFVLNGKEKQMRISEDLANKVRAVATKEGYKPNQVAVSLRTGQSKILGLIVESIGGTFFGALAKVIEKEADKYGYRIVYCSTENDPAKGREMLRVLSHSNVDGYMMTPVEGMEKDVMELLKSKRPVVLIDGYFPDIPAPYVLVNNAAGVTQGMNHLISRGYSKIGFVTVDIDLVQIREREQAYIAALKKHKLGANRKLMLTLEYNYDKQAGVKAISKFIKDHPEMDAIFFATYYLGISGLQSVQELKLRIPKDLAMVCFDDHDIFALYPPGVTTIAQPVEQIGITAVSLLIQQLGKDKKTITQARVEIDGDFIQRGST
ncbi:MAG: LacI family DNA-binding transcriptional regulator [Flavitalea sp.]